MENLRLIGTCSNSDFTKEQDQIRLLLRLTRKNVDALSQFPLSDAFSPGYEKFCITFEKMEQEYRSGIHEPAQWAVHFFTWADKLSKYSELL